jgi:hypothetical protein
MRQLYPLAADEVGFLLDAVEHYCSSRCPLQRGSGYCPMLTWRESVFTGAIERVCRSPVASWRQRLAGGIHPEELTSPN